MLKFILAALLASAVAGQPAAAAELMLRASHQWPGGQGDIRDDMVQIVARELEQSGTGLTVRIYPGESLFKAREQWGALTKGQLDLTLLPLDYASGRVPAFSATLMPGLVGSHERAKRLNDSPFMTEIKRIIEDNGAVVIADAWLAGAFASKQSCITNPDSIKGQVIRAAGPGFERMLATAGASIASMPSSDIYTAMQTGVLDAAMTSSESFVSYRLQEQVKCLTAPGENALWFMYEPMLMAKRTWDRLSDAQKAAVMAAGDAAEAVFAEKAALSDQVLVETFRAAGVEVREMSRKDYDAWRAVAAESAYKAFAADVEGGQALIDMALSAE